GRRRALHQQLLLQQGWLLRPRRRVLRRGLPGRPPCDTNIRCGNQAELGIGEVCTKNVYCSKWGYCGLGPEYCATGCQNGACSTYEPCGRQAGGTPCTNNYCCSQYDSCGRQVGSLYCGAGCQTGRCYDFVAGAVTGNGTARMNFTLRAE
uniref:Chitin-binding type-1 domain-containing protein n=1 Tax=Triticum urartu TaxID=4572 RepID=A0A8R7P9A5_TRIUA